MWMLSSKREPKKSSTENMMNGPTLWISYKHGIIERNYPEMMVKELQEIIMGPHMDYYPVLLRDSDDYNEESGHQKNCVRTYVERPDCFIISIREGSRNGKERATVEFQI